MDYRERITVNPDMRFGKPCIRGMRITVYDVLSYLASGMSHEEILTDFPYLEEGDIRASLAFAADGEKRVQRVLKHYEEQTEEEAVAEDEAAFADSGQTVMKVPSELVPEIRELIARHKA